MLNFPIANGTWMSTGVRVASLAKYRSAVTSDVGPLIVAISFFAAFVYFVNLRWGFKSPVLKYVSCLLNRFKNANHLYAMNVSLLLLLISILPAGAFFKYAYESEIRLFIKHAQYSVTTALAVPSKDHCESTTRGK